MGLMGGELDEFCEPDPVLPARSLLPRPLWHRGVCPQGNLLPLGNKPGAVAKGRELVCAQAQPHSRPCGMSPGVCSSTAPGG